MGPFGDGARTRKAGKSRIAVDCPTDPSGDTLVSPGAQRDRSASDAPSKRQRKQAEKRVEMARSCPESAASLLPRSRGGLYTGSGRAFSHSGGTGASPDQPMDSEPVFEVYSPHEIARAVGVPEDRVVAAIGRADVLIRHAEAVEIGRALVRPRAVVVSDSGRTPPMAPSRTLVLPPPSLFSIFNSTRRDRPAGVPLAVSSTVHAGLMAASIFLSSLDLAPTASALNSDHDRVLDLHLAFLMTPGPGGGGGGGGLQQKKTPPRALRDGTHRISSPVPLRKPLPRIAPAVAPPEPKPAPLAAEPLPILAAPIVSAPADHANRVGLLQQAREETDSHGQGSGGGVGSGTGTGIGAGNGSGVGPGSDAGIGGGPYHSGSGIEPPRVVREIKADYTEEARRRNIEGDVILEIIVKQDGSVSNMKVLHGLEAGLNDRAMQAVRQWQFSPARRFGSPVDVVVEVAVEFKLR